LEFRRVLFRSRSGTACLRIQRIREGRSSAAGGCGKGSAKCRRAIAAGEKLSGAAAARRGDQKRGAGGGYRRAEFDLPRVAGESVRRESRSRELVFCDFAGQEDAQGI